MAAAVRETLETREAPFAISAHIRAAHRLVKIRPSDWGFLACRADSDSRTVWINTCGTFGISSAPYWCIHALWDIKQEFDVMRAEAKAAAVPGDRKRKRQDKTPW